jgi:dCTP deaminase
MRLVDWQIRDLCVWSDDCEELKWYKDKEGKPQPMLEPFSEAVQSNSVVPKVISYGLTHAGYDLRLGTEFVEFINSSGSYGQLPIINPKMFGDTDYDARVLRKWSQTQPVVIPPLSYILGMSLEYIRIPPWLVAECTGKSTLARSGILINTTPLEPGWECIEIGNVTSLPAVIFPREGICQLLFTNLDATPETTYAGKNGKYQGQTGVTLAKV